MSYPRPSSDNVRPLSVAAVSPPSFEQQEPLAALLGSVLDAAIALTDADFGNIQLIDADGRLRIVAQRNFPDWWVVYGDAAANAHGVCGAALVAGERVVVEDVECSPFFVDPAAIDCQRRAGVRAVQSTPLRGHGGEMLGMFSTHCREPFRPDAKMLSVLDLLATHAAALIERRQAELALRERDAQYRAVIETSTDGFWMLDDDGRFLVVNDAYAARSGYSVEELLDMGIADVEASESPAAIRQHLALIRDRGSHLFETTHRTQSGEVWPVEINVNYSSDAGGKFFSFLRDISERKRAETALRESESRLRRAQAAAKVGTWEWDLETGANYWTDETYRLYGYELRGVTPSHDAWFDSVHPDDQRVAAAIVLDGARRGVPLELEWRVATPDNEPRWLFSRGHPEVDANGWLSRYLGIVMDITERKQAQLALEHTRRRLTEAQATAHIGSFEYDVNADTTIWSEEEYRIFGFDPAEPSPTYQELLRRCIHPDDAGAQQRAFGAALEGQTVYDCEYRIVRSDGSTRWVHTQAHPCFDAQGNVERYVGTTHDITERKQAEAAQIAAKGAEQASETKTRFLAAASHDLRQPLQAIALYADTLGLSALSTKQQGLLAKIAHSVCELGDILNQLLDISKLDAGHVHAEPSAVPVETLLGAIDNEFLPIADAKQLHFRRFVARRCPPLLTDPQLLLTVLRNLVGNALKYTARGGVLIGVRRRGACALLQVWDTGIGIAPENLPRIFDEYFQVGNPARDRTQGYGLGLSIVRRLAALLQTEIGCRSVPGKGSVFEIRLPLADADNRQSGKTRPQVAVAGAPQRLAVQRVVVVEDDAEVANALRLAFETCELQPLVFGSAEEALASPQVQGADYYVCDYRLPGIDGLQFLAAIRERAPAPVKAVLVSGETSPERIALAQASGWPLLTKPTGFAELLSALEGQQDD